MRGSWRRRDRSIGSTGGDESVIPEGALVKIDLGVHIDGYVADTAKTVCLDPRLSHMVEAAEAALDAATRLKEAWRAFED